MDMERSINEGLTGKIGASIERLATCELPREALDTARRGLVDYIGVLLAGSREQPAQTLLKALGPSRSSEARLFPSGVRVAAQDAALVNGVAGHVLDYDDVAIGGHPARCCVRPCWRKRRFLNATAADLLRAYVAGYETWATLWKAWPAVSASCARMRAHPSGVFGPIAVAAACATLRRLDAKVSGHAIALAAVQSGGLIANSAPLQNRSRSAARGRRHFCNANGGSRLRCLANGAGARVRIPHRVCGRRPGRRWRLRRSRLVHPHRRPRHQDVPDVLRHASADRQRAAIAPEATFRARPDRRGRSAHRPASVDHAAQPSADHRARSQVQRGICRGLRPD